MTANSALADHACIQVTAVWTLDRLRVQAPTDQQGLYLLALQGGDHTAQSHGAAGIALGLANHFALHVLQIVSAALFQNASRMRPNLFRRGSYRVDEEAPDQALL